jgi:hypothetical protein
VPRAREGHGWSPLLDDQVFMAALAVPPEKRNRPGRYKLLAEVVNGITPPEITRRTTKGEFSIDFYQELRHTAPASWTFWKTRTSPGTG